MVTRFSSERPLLVIGGNGQVGTAIRALLPAAVAAAPGRSDLDIENPESVRGVLRSRNWAAAVNCAAYTAVDKAEEERDAAYRLNADAAETLARETAACGIPLVHVSTDYVFDGRKQEPYVEEDPADPQNVYGASKWAGEEAVRSANPRHAVVRTAWIVSPWGRNFLKTMVSLAAEKDEVSVVGDQFGCPTSASDLAEGLLLIAARMAEGGEEAPAGTWHFVNAGTASWHDLGVFIFERMAAAGQRVPSAVRAIPTSDYPTPARRPANSVLSTERFERDFGLRPRPWRDAVERDLNLILNETGKADAA